MTYFYLIEVCTCIPCISPASVYNLIRKRSVEYIVLDMIVEWFMTIIIEFIIRGFTGDYITCCINEYPLKME